MTPPRSAADRVATGNRSGGDLRILLIGTRWPVLIRDTGDRRCPLYLSDVSYRRHASGWTWNDRFAFFGQPRCYRSSVHAYLVFVVSIPIISQTFLELVFICAIDFIIVVVVDCHYCLLLVSLLLLFINTFRATGAYGYILLTSALVF